MYGSEEGRLRAVEAYLREGLDQNERVIVVVHPDTPERFRAQLTELVDYSAEILAGQVMVFPSSAFHERVGIPTRKRLETLHRQLVDQAKQDGFAGVRAAVDVTFYLDELAPEASLEEFETAVGKRFAFEFRLLCMLDASSAEAAGGVESLGLVKLHADIQIEE